MTAYERIFAAVFPPPSEASLPTPKATPLLDLGAFEGSAEAQTLIDWEPQDSATEQVQWERAWHTATTFLSLPSEELPPAHGESNRNRLHGKWWKTCTPEISAAIKYLVSPDSKGLLLRKTQMQHDLLHWYFEEVGLRHFVHFVRPPILEALKNDNFGYGISNVINYLEQGFIIYLRNLKLHVYPFCHNQGEEEERLFMSKLMGLFTYSLPQRRINDILSKFLKERAELMLEVMSKQQGTEEQCVDRQTRMILWRLQDCGLGSIRIRKLFAEVMNEVLSVYIWQTYARRWQSHSDIAAKLRYWVENRFARVIVEVLSVLNTSPSKHPNYKRQNTMVDDDTNVTLADLDKWQEIALNRLGALRTEELFDVVVQWENDSQGAIEDLKLYVTTTIARTHLTKSFSNTLNRRLLQPGAATTEILRTYIAIIRAFSALDPKGVLLDRVARPIRRYLRDRDDTVGIVVASLLADAKDTDILPELAKEMDSSEKLAAQEGDDADLDFDDMEWVPDPVDAGPDYKKSKHLDVIGSLISLFESKDIFVKEFQQVLGERLLKEGQDFEKEIRVLELLKARFGEASLQACEVMLRDILDSHRVDTVIRNDQNLVMTTTGEPHAEVHARILSHLFWPSLHSESFSLPPEISTVQARYEKGFETLKQSRKLTWLNALGQVTVHLELEDRSVTEVVQTWQASVIYAFQDDGGSPKPATRTVTQLMNSLSMSESLVRNALTFWVGKLVLAPLASSPDAYNVLETLPTSALHPARTASGSTTTSGLLNAAAAAEAATSASVPHAVRSEEDIMMEKMEVFWQFVVGMLTNQGAMPLTRIVMMLKVVVPGGFPFGNEELKEFLEGRVRDGKLEVVGGQYRIKG
ncbi:MAG: hypothetical protein LQ338_002463 [Usnochroma carphineum]|nr:MAG: hypothetical protein LQ338_002463 [Usnochroma carphineum]